MPPLGPQPYECQPFQGNAPNSNRSRTIRRIMLMGVVQFVGPEGAAPPVSCRTSPLRR
jgi:hypothetical protein